MWSKSERFGPDCAHELKKRLKGHPIPSHPVSAGQAPVPPSGSCFLPPSWRSGSPLAAPFVHASCNADTSGYRRSAFSSRNSIHAFKNALPLCVWWHESVRLSLPLRLPWSLVVEVNTRQENRRQTYFLTVSESPMTVNDRLGRVMATAHIFVSRRLTFQG